MNRVAATDTQDESNHLVQLHRKGDPICLDDTNVFVFIFLGKHIKGETDIQNDSLKIGC